MDGKKQGRNEWVDVLVRGIFHRGEEHTSIVNPTERIRHFAIAFETVHFEQIIGAIIRIIIES